MQCCNKNNGHNFEKFHATIKSINIIYESNESATLNKKSTLYKQIKQYFAASMPTTALRGFLEKTTNGLSFFIVKYSLAFAVKF
jgi:hypothetical protein